MKVTTVVSVSCCSVLWKFMCSQMYQVAIDIIKKSPNLIYEDNKLIKTHKKETKKKLWENNACSGRTPFQLIHTHLCKDFDK